MQMQKVSICALRQDRKTLLESLQSAGVMEVCDTPVEDRDDFSTVDTFRERQSFEKAMSVLEQALTLLRTYDPKKQSPFASLAGKELISADEQANVLQNKEELMRSARRVVKMDKECAALQAEIVKLQNQSEALTPWLSLDVSSRMMETKRTVVIPGSFQGMLNSEQLYTLLKEKLPDLDTVDAELLSCDHAISCVAVYCMREDRAVVEDALRSAGFAKPAVSFDEAPPRMRDELIRQAGVHEKQIEELAQEIAKMSACARDLSILSDYYRIRLEKYEVLGGLLHTRRTCVVTGYVPTKKVERMKDYLEKRLTCIIDVQPADGEDCPVLLKNNPFSASFESVVEGYGAPMTGEMDPTTIMSFFYVFFFGMMLSDAAYGAILSVCTFVLLKKFPRMDAGMKKSMRLFFYCGLSTLVWGVLFGGYFGNIVDIVSAKFFGKTVVVPALWFVPLSDPMRLLVYSMAFGMIHLFVGLGLKGYLCIRDKRYMDFLCDVVAWFCLLVGLILMLIPSSLFASIAQTQIVFPAVVDQAAHILAAGGAVAIVLMSGRGTKNPGLRIALGAYDLYNITGWLSDALSYSRLLALGLATGVIASVINQMGSMMPNNIIGVIGFIVIFIFGHTLNLAINLLGAYVHTNRLQFVEFFGKFYEGGGRLFRPFSERTKYMDIKEDTTL